jgi:hypothetical protein
MLAQFMTTICVYTTLKVLPQTTWTGSHHELQHLTSTYPTPQVEDSNS